MLPRVAKTGTQKPYGRVFYTKGKSLVFNAYDHGGWCGPDRDQALNLGVFYEDSEAKKRWILRFALAQIDAVFVTVEPNGGSNKSSTKPLLFAYHRMDPNHP
jgi:hypothetical protein